MNVSNRNCIRRLATKSMRAAMGRNLIAVIAIALTALLFTSLFTIAISINTSMQEANFRQAGGWSHGSFKYITEEQAEILQDDPLIKEFSMRLLLGMATGPAFSKSHVEVSYCDANETRWMYCEPTEGRLPQEGTNEAATDTRVLELLGVEPRLGAEFALPILVDGEETTQTFTLCGWWDYDEGITANHILIPLSRVQDTFDELDTQGLDGMTTFWGMDVMVASSRHIERDLKQVLENHGFQSEGRNEGDNYIGIGVNWGYTGAQFADKMDPQMLLIIITLLLLILLTGYLIIYNVFRISVTNNIRFYGLLKTIGTTARQLRRVIRIQALTLSCIGIPLGLLVGYGVGVGLTPVILAQLNGVVMEARSNSPIIFVGAALFSLVTVLISCMRPGRLAGKVSPIEAVRYTEGGGIRKKLRKAERGASIPRMAWANLWRSRSKTIITIFSLALAVLVLNLTVTFTNGFDMEKFVSKSIASDFIVAQAEYFQVTRLWSGTDLSEEVVQEIEAQDGRVTGGRVYGQQSVIKEFVTEDYFRSMGAMYTTPEQVEQMLSMQDRDERGLVLNEAKLYGMEDYALEKLKLVEGDLSKLRDGSGRYIAAVLMESDYEEAYLDSHWAKLGDMVKLRYVEEYEFLDPESGRVLTSAEMDSGAAYTQHAKVYRDVEYEVAALVCVPHSLSYRYYGEDQFVLDAQTFQKDSGTNSIMYYAMDAEDSAIPAWEDFFSHLTNEERTDLDYESKATYAEEFEGFRSMFLLLGGVLSGIIALVGVLNFFNAIMTGILTRRREFAVLQSVGMTGKQLKSMLILEGLFLTLGTLVLTFLLTLATGPMMANVLSAMFWFFTYHFTMLPILCTLPIFALMGVILPLLMYRSVAKHSVVERLRESE